jgi:hypothetical protein
MSLVNDYSSGEEDAILPTRDAFGLASLPVAKKTRSEDVSTVAMVAQAAPPVLSEVSLIR